MDLNRLRAVGSESLVQIQRTHGDRLHGFIAGVGRKWLLLHLVWDLDRAGLTAVRIADIRRVVLDRAGDDVAVRSLRQRGLLPEPVDSVRLDRTADVLVDVQARGGLVTIHPERRWPGSCHLGVVTGVDVTRKRFALLEVSTAAVWDRAPTSWRLRDVRRIDSGDPYALALAALAGPPPSRPSTVTTDGGLR